MKRVLLFSLTSLIMFFFLLPQVTVSATTYDIYSNYIEPAPPETTIPNPTESVITDPMESEFPGTTIDSITEETTETNAPTPSDSPEPTISNPTESTITNPIETEFPGTTIDSIPEETTETNAPTPSNSPEPTISNPTESTITNPMEPEFPGTTIESIPEESTGTNTSSPSDSSEPTILNPTETTPQEISINEISEKSEIANSLLIVGEDLGSGTLTNVSLLDTNTLELIENINNPVITVDMVTDRLNPTGVANPYIIYKDGVYHMFFDVLGGYNPATQASSEEIGHAWSTDLVDWNYTQIVLGNETHGTRAASAYVFMYENEYYMVPDLVGNVSAYKATDFPLKWEFYSTLLTGSFVDPLIFQKENIWYMAVSENPYNNVSLYYNASGDWRNTNWLLHPAGNIISASDSETGLRTAGNPIIYEDSVVLPIQVTPTQSGVYGEYTYWYKLSNLSVNTVSVTNLGLAVSSQKNEEWNGEAMHHISNAAYNGGYIYAVDGYQGGTYAIGLYTDGKPVVPPPAVIPPSVIPFGQVNNPVITVDMVTDRLDPTGVADPFIYFENGVYHMIFEVVGGFNSLTGVTADELAHAYSTDLMNWTYTSIIFGIENQGTRAAYPSILKQDNEYYIIPDTTTSIQVYKTSEFPINWEYITTLIEGHFVDSNIFQVGDMWYLTTSEWPYNSISLYYNPSGDWLNSEWLLHPINNIINETIEERGFRGAGNLFIYDDYVILPIQVTPTFTGVYGEYTYWYMLSNLSSSTVNVTNLGLAVTAQYNGEWNGEAMHHISHTSYNGGYIYAVDGYQSGTYSIGLYIDKVLTA